MSLTYRFYRTERIGTGGLIPSEKDPGAFRVDAFRSVLDAYITIDGTGQSFWDWVHDARPIRYALARCEAATHALLAADPRIIPLSPLCPDLAALSLWLDTPVSGDVPLLTQLDADGCATDGVTVQTTRRSLLRALMHRHVMAQEARRAKAPAVLDVLGRTLETTMRDLPLATRQALRAWMAATGMTAVPTANSATLREVVRYIAQGRAWPTLTLGPLEL